MVLGDSYINRLQTFSEAGCPNLKLASTDWWVCFNDKAGGIIQHMQVDLLPKAVVFKPEIMFFHIGANDLCKSCISPGKLAADIVELAEVTITSIKEIKYAVIGGLIRRSSSDLTLEEYNKRIIETNDVLEMRVAECNYSERIRYWKHRGFSSEADWLAKMDYDGVHLNEFGMMKFANSVKNAITHAQGNITRFDLQKMVKANGVNF